MRGIVIKVVSIFHTRRCDTLGNDATLSGHSSVITDVIGGALAIPVMIPNERWQLAWGVENVSPTGMHPGNMVSPGKGTKKTKDLIEREEEQDEGRGGRREEREEGRECGRERDGER